MEPYCLVHTLPEIMKMIMEDGVCPSSDDFDMVDLVLVIWTTNPNRKTKSILYADVFRIVDEHPLNCPGCKNNKHFKEAFIDII